jgi:hypothetical protein
MRRVAAVGLVLACFLGVAPIDGLTARAAAEPSSAPEVIEPEPGLTDLPEQAAPTALPQPTVTVTASPPPTDPPPAPTSSPAPPSSPTPAATDLPLPTTEPAALPPTLADAAQPPFAFPPATPLPPRRRFRPPRLPCRPPRLLRW